MKKTVARIIAWPVVVIVGWIGARLSQKYVDALADLDPDFDYE